MIFQIYFLIIKLKCKGISYEKMHMASILVLYQYMGLDGTLNISHLKLNGMLGKVLRRCG